MSQTADNIAHLETLDRPELIQAWTTAYGAPPFKGARKPSLVRGLAYGIQRKTHGGLNKSIQRQLLKIARTGEHQNSKLKSSAPKVKLGTQLVREWNGTAHSVHVTDQGFVMNGVTYGSLSAVAKAITGAHWSGPRFFGVSR